MKEPICPYCKKPLAITERDGGDPLDRWQADCMTAACSAGIWFGMPTKELLFEVANSWEPRR